MEQSDESDSFVSAKRLRETVGFECSGTFCVVFHVSRQTMATEWYYGEQGKHEGPVDFQTLKELARSGAISDTTLVWREGMSDWLQAKQVKGIFEPPLPPPFPHPQVEKTPSTDGIPKPSPVQASGAASNSVQSPPDRGSQSFREWYSHCFLARLPIYVQCGVWFFYGFLWIPVWYLVSQKKHTQRWHRVSPHVRVVGVGCISIFAILVALGAMITILTPESKERIPGRSDSIEATRSVTLSERFLTPPAGEDLHYSQEVIRSDSGEVDFCIESRHHFVASDRANVTITNDLLPSAENMAVHRVDQVMRTTRSGKAYAQYNGALILVGAQVGDEWTDKRGNASYRFVGVVEGANPIEAIIESKSTGSLYKTDDSTVEVRTVLRDGVGIVSQESHFIFNGERILGDRTTLLSP